MGLKAIGRYEIVRPLGEGGMGTVWIARDPDIQREVVLKGLRLDFAVSAEARERLLREARALGRLDHPHIVQVYDLIEQDGQWYICMQRVEGRTLREVLQDGPLDASRIETILSGIASALVAAHRVDIVHRDIKPENIVITPAGEAKLLDFGIAWRPTDVSLTATDASVGTVLAMAPEQFVGERADQRSDLFSVGSVAFEMATGVHPFAGKTGPEVAYKIVNQAPELPTQIAGGLPVELLHVISKCLEKDPAYRYQHASELVADLLRLRRELSGGAPDVAHTAERPGPMRGLKSAIAAGQLREVPHAPQAPSKRLIVALGACGLLAAATLAGLRPAQDRVAEHVAIGPGEAESHARAVLARLGASPYGNAYYTRVTGAPQLTRFLTFMRLPEPDRARIERWRPLVKFATFAASADRQDRYEVTVDDSLRLLSLTHHLRPGSKPSDVDADSAAAIARALLRDEFKLDLAGWEALPATETASGDRREREFRWRMRSPLPARMTAGLLVRLAGDQVVQADVEVLMPGDVAQALNDERNLPNMIVWTVLVVLALAAALYAGLRRWFVLPSARFVALATCASTVSLLLVTYDSLRLRNVEKGALDLGVLVASITAGGLFLGVATCAFLALFMGILNVTGPHLIPGLSGVLGLRVSRRTWARSAAVGLAAGALAAAAERFGPPLAQGLGLATYWPGPDLPGLFGLQPLGEGVAYPAFMWPFLVACVASFALLQSRLKLGPWVWLIGVLCGAVISVDSSGLEVQPGLIEYVLAAGGYVIVTAALLRFGLLAALIALTSWALLSNAVVLFGPPVVSVRLMGVAFFAAWLGVFAWALIQLKERDAPLG